MADPKRSKAARKGWATRRREAKAAEKERARLARETSRLVKEEQRAIRAQTKAQVALEKAHLRAMRDDPDYKKAHNWKLAQELAKRLGLANVTREVPAEEGGRRHLLTGVLFDLGHAHRRKMIEQLRTTGNGAIDLLELLSEAEDRGQFYAAAELAAEEFDMDVSDVYDLWHGYGDGFSDVGG